MLGNIKFIGEFRVENWAFVVLLWRITFTPTSPSTITTLPAPHQPFHHHNTTGELGKLEMVQEGILHECIQQLIARKSKYPKKMSQSSFNHPHKSSSSSIQKVSLTANQNPAPNCNDGLGVSNPGRVISAAKSTQIGVVKIAQAPGGGGKANHYTDNSINSALQPTSAVGSAFATASNHYVSSSLPSPDDLECLCQILKTVGSKGEGCLEFRQFTESLYSAI